MRDGAAKAMLGWLAHAGDHPLYPALHALSTLGPVGYVPLGPGTAGSLVPLALWLAFGPVPPWTLSILPPVTILAVAAAGDVARFEEKADPPEIVIDEAIGMWLALGLAPSGPLAALAAFAAFRGLDVAKPFPIRWLERLPGGSGILADDVGAALYAAASVRLVWLALGLS